MIGAMQELCDATAKAVEAITIFASEYVNAITSTDAFAKMGCASKKEWHYFMHAKKCRVRKKYINRFLKRISENRE